MRIFLWASGAVLLGVAALGFYWAFQSPTFVAGLSALAAAAAWKAIAPAVAQRRAPEDEAKDRAEHRAGHGDDYWRRRSGAPPKG